MFVCTVGDNTTIPSGGNPYPLGNKFEDCNKCVQLANNRYSTVKANYFTATTTSTPIVTTGGTPPAVITNPNTYYYMKAQSAIWVTATGTSGDMSYNYIRNHGTGIFNSHTLVSGGGTPSLDIVDNNIAAPSSTGWCMQAIQVNQVGGNNFATDKLNISNNRIEQVYRGVIANSVLNGLLIKSNNISVESTTKTLNYPATSQRTGVVLNSCEYGYIKGNSFTQNGSTPTTSTTANYINGTFLTGSKFGKVECNSATKMGRCFVFQGTSDNNWLVNNMSNSYTGLEIRVLGRIGIQGAATGTPNLSANTWTTITQETNVLSSAGNNTISPLYVAAGAGTQPTLNFGTAGHAYITNPAQGIRLSTGTSYTCNSGSAQRLGNTPDADNKRMSNTDDSLTALISLAQSDETAYDVFTNEFIYQNKQLVYKLLKQGIIQSSEGSVLDEFYQANQHTAIDKLTEAQLAIANEDLSLASSANAAAPVHNEAEYKHQKTNELALKYLADHAYIYSTTEIHELQTLANECIVKGYYVVQARNILNIVTGQITNYADNCEAEVNATRKIKSSASTSQISFVIMPNPNNGSMILIYDLGNYTKAKFELLDIAGKIISNSVLEGSVGSLTINEQNLGNGIYFYRILVEENIIKTDKIVIIK